MSTVGFLTVEQAFLQIMQSDEGQELAKACFYDWDVIAACRRFKQSEEWLEISQIIAAARISGRALDLGAGNGIASYALAGIGFSVDSVEPDPSSLVGYGALNVMVQKSQLPIRHHATFGEELGFENSTFELVYARQVLHHASDLKKMLCEISRVLKPGGVLIASREHVIDDKQSLEQFLKNHPLQKFTGGEYAYTVEEYSAAISHAGLTMEKCLGSWDSVINFYPVSNKDLRSKMNLYASKRFGGLGRVLPFFPAWRKRYKNLLSTSDKHPGRLYTFIAQKPLL